MRRSSSIVAMIALAAILCAPVIIEAQNSLFDPVLPAAAPAPGVAPSGGAGPAGRSVYNDQNEMIGSVGDVLIDDGAGVFEVLALGGFRGVGGKLVEIPDDMIQVVNDRLVIAGTTKDRLMQLPEYSFGSRS